LNSTNGQLNITSYCDYYGPSYPIKISIKAYGSEVQVIPSTTLIINGGGCAKNRIVYNSSAADALLALPNNGTSKYLSPLSNSTVLANATRMSASQAALQFGGGIIPEFSSAALLLVFAGVAVFAVFANKKQRYTRILR
jgi:archaellum component FlaF (FlaF/FlaG flagellin family)